MREGWLSSVGAVDCVARLLGGGDVVELSEIEGGGGGDVVDFWEEEEGEEEGD